MSALRTVILGLLLGALTAILLQGCDNGCGEYPCPRVELRPFSPGLYLPPDAGVPGAETRLRFTLDAARARATERYERGGRVVETE